jgi:hypothetical protein
MFEQATKPTGSAPIATGYAGLVFLLLSVITIKAFPVKGGYDDALIVLSVPFLAMLVCEAWVRLRGRMLPCDGDIDFYAFHTDRLRRGLNAGLWIKVYALAITYGGLIAASHLFPFHTGAELTYLKHILFSAAPWLVLPGFFYIWVTHSLMVDPHDTLWHFGRRLLPGGRKKTDVERVYQHILGWTIKGFFLPLMAMYYLQEWGYIENRVAWMSGLWTGDMKSFYEDAYRLFYFIDLAFCTIGYSAALSLLNTHIRYSEWRAGGWFICLICYAPIWPIVTTYYIDYWDGLRWGEWLNDAPLLYDLWALMILGSLTIYTWATVCFGLRFSNLTHRGIITHGPYAFMKHPAYLSKNISWWLIDIPFIAVSWPEALKNSLMLIQVNLIYYFRARYEESMLSRDPVYTRYKDGIHAHGRLSWQMRRVFLRSRD